MSTHATVGYELPDGGYAGCYLHFDGYPDSVVPALLKSGHDGVMMAVEKALLEGGFRCFLVDEIETFVEAHGISESSTRDEHLSSEWPCQNNAYNYIIRLDGSVECVRYDGIPADISKYVKKFQESA